MRYRPHFVFRKSQQSVGLELPNDVFFDVMSLLKQVNRDLDNGYKLTGDDLFCMAMEDFTEKYVGQVQSLLKRIGAR